MSDTHQPSSDEQFVRSAEAQQRVERETLAAREAEKKRQTANDEQAARWEKYKEEREAREAEEKRQAAQREQPTPETVAAKYADSAHRSSIETIPNPERGSTARVPAPADPYPSYPAPTPTADGRT